MSLVLGVDSSTQSVKVEVRDVESGRVVDRASAPHPAVAPPSSEQDPVAWWSALVSAVRTLGPDLSGVVAMAVAAQQHGLVVLDDTGAPVRPALLWNDTTAAPQADALVASRGGRWWARRCGSVPVPAFTIAKLAWLAEREPENLARVARLMLPHDYLTWRLTGHHVTDRGDASGTGWFDPRTDRYDPDLLATVVDDPDRWLDTLPRVLGPRDQAGELTPDAASELGLEPGVAVAVGTGDNMAGALGLGLAPGDVVMSLGTSGTVYSVSDEPTADATGAVAGFADATGRFLPLVCTLNATRVTDTVAEWLGTDAAGLSELALTAGNDASELVLVPYFDGERTPNLPNASGAFFGLRTTTTRAQLARAAHDGVLCGLLDGLDALVAAGVNASGRVHLIGGGSRSAAYRQRAADLRGTPIVVPDADETVATGAAVQAAMLATGASLGEMTEAWSLGAGTTVEPAAGSRATEVRAAFATQRESLVAEHGGAGNLHSGG